jgi:ubiquinone/menaquinone biosynthesis C-methylase UbiE
MAAPFDHIEPIYNSAFSRSTIGQLQSKSVWDYLETVMPDLKGFEMLELNCGQQEEAALFGDKGHNIIATDIGIELLKLTNRRKEQFSMHNRISSQYLDLDNFDETVFDKKFDLVFSNFGGLNCMNPQTLKTLLNKLPKILKPGGRFIGIVMPKFCMWETVFFLLRFQFKKAFRRFTSRDEISQVRNSEFRTWYYHPSEIKKWSRERFKVVAVSPVGLALPAAYLETFVTFQKRMLLRLNRVEKKLARISSFSGVADHFIVDLKLVY